MPKFSVKSADLFVTVLAILVLGWWVSEVTRIAANMEFPLSSL